MVTRILTNDCVVCELDDNIPVLRHRWIKKPTGEEFMEGLQTMQREYNKLKPEYPDLKWLADTELLGELSDEVEEWLTETWDHLLFEESGVKAHAVILGEDLYADYPMEKFKMSSAEKFDKMGVKLALFADINSAYEWLRSV